MKYTIRQIAEGEDEVILKYRRMTPEVRRILRLLNGEQQKIVGQKETRFGEIGTKEKIQTVLDREQILYIESVDGRTFAYTEEEVVQLEYSLYQMSQILDDINFFRCSKSMIINIDKVRTLKSLSSNRIDAAMSNGEHIVISRTYASDFRKRLRGGRDGEE